MDFNRLGILDRQLVATGDNLFLQQRLVLNSPINDNVNPVKLTALPIVLFGGLMAPLDFVSRSFAFGGRRRGGSSGISGQATLFDWRPNLPSSPARS